jgi:hypothetical protein
MNCINYFRYKDGQEIDSDAADKYSIKITNDTLGSYLSFDGEAGANFGKKYLNFTCEGSTKKGQMNHTTRLGNELFLASESVYWLVFCLCIRVDLLS